MCNATTTAAGPSRHPFEKAGLGKAPFQYLGMTREVGPIMCEDGGMIGAPGQPMGTCDYCGQGIANVCRVRSSDGNVFRVGCDCVAKVYKEYGNESADPIQRQVDRDRRAHEAKARKARETAKMAEVNEWFTANEEVLRVMPHPTRAGETCWDQVQWFLRNAGRSGLLRLHRQLAKLMADNN